MPYSEPKYVVYRNGQLELDNGNCHSPRQLLYFAGRGPARRANCKVNEVDVPRVVGETVAAANARLASMPLTPNYVYQPAKPREPLGIVLRQYPARGTLSSYQKVTLVLPKALHGIVPKVVGLRYARAKARLSRFHLRWKVDGAPPGSAIVTWQSPRGHTAATKGLVVRLAVKGG
jgi:beta-lactam-binding protein with PASTA domain